MEGAKHLNNRTRPVWIRLAKGAMPNRARSGHVPAMTGMVSMCAAGVVSPTTEVSPSFMPAPVICKAAERDNLDEKFIESPRDRTSTRRTDWDKYFAGKHHVKPSC